MTLGCKRSQGSSSDDARKGTAKVPFLIEKIMKFLSGLQRCLFMPVKKDYDEFQSRSMLLWR
jgi:hypothetical protein